MADVTRLPASRLPRSGRRRATARALASAIVLPGLLTAVLLWISPAPGLALVLPLYLLSAVLVALQGGLVPAVLAAAVASLLANWFFVAPRGTLQIADPANVVELIVALLVASAVASLVDANARRTAAALDAQAEATALSELSQLLLGAPDQLGLLLRRALETFGVRGAAVVRRPAAAAPPVVVAAAGAFDPDAPASERTAAGPGHELVLQPAGLPPGARRLFAAYGVHAAAILHRRELEASASIADALARDNRARTALLSAVSHDLRTPLAGIKAAIGSLRSHDVQWSPEDVEELQAAIEDSADRLDALIGNLLDLSRLQAGAVVAHPRDVDLGEVIPATIQGLTRPELASWAIDPDARYAVADPGLLERVLANVLENALRFQPPDAGPVRVRARRRGDRCEIVTTDAGIGVPDDQLDRIFQPFQRLGDSHGEGTGLGLAVARGLTEAMDGTLHAERAPGGGLSVVAALPAPPEGDHR